MLILTRNPGDSINIGDDINITVLDVSGRQVRIGINAPKNIAVHRHEIYERIQRNKKEKASGEDTFSYVEHEEGHIGNI